MILTKISSDLLCFVGNVMTFQKLLEKHINLVNDFVFNYVEKQDAFNSALFRRGL